MFQHLRLWLLDLSMLKIGVFFGKLTNPSSARSKTVGRTRAEKQVYAVRTARVYGIGIGMRQPETRYVHQQNAEERRAANEF